MKNMKTLQDLLVHELEDLYSAEQQIIEALPNMIENAKNTKLKKSLNDHLKVTRQQKARLDKIKDALGEEETSEPGFFARLFGNGDEGNKHCKAMEGLIEEGENFMSEEMDPDVMDAGIIASAQKIEHYEIASYGTVKAYAIQLGLKKVAKLIDETLNEEYFADDSLTSLAVGRVNLEAEKGEELSGLKKLPASRNKNNNGRVSRTNGSAKTSRTRTKTKSASRTTKSSSRRRSTSRK
jgi:ferritin-like metal-binding protein YciE